MRAESRILYARVFMYLAKRTGYIAISRKDYLVMVSEHERIYISVSKTLVICTFVLDKTIKWQLF